MPSGTTGAHGLTAAQNATEDSGPDPGSALSETQETQDAWDRLTRDSLATTSLV